MQHACMHGAGLVSINRLYTQIQGNGICTAEIDIAGNAGCMCNSNQQ